MIESILQWYLEHLNYWVVTLLMIIESSFIPFPSEIIVPPAAYMAATGKQLNLFLIILVATIGADLGAVFNYYLSLWLGRPLIYKIAQSRVGKFLLISPEKLDKAEKYFRHKGAVSTLVGRLIPGIRQLISIPAGLARMPLKSFLVYTTLGAGIWNTILALLGYSVSKIPGINTPQKAIEMVSVYSKEIGYTILVLAVLIIVYKVIREGSKRKS